MCGLNQSAVLTGLSCVGVLPCRPPPSEGGGDYSTQLAIALTKGFTASLPIQSEGSTLTFAVHVAVAAGQPPVEVVRADGLHVAVARAVEQHALLDLHRPLDFAQLGFLPVGVGTR